MSIQISMVDLVAEHDAYRKAYHKQMITKQMLEDAEKLSESLCKLCLGHQIETFNMMVAQINKDKTPKPTEGANNEQGKEVATAD